ncbi:archease [Sphaerisporangium fuscum]|uniref:archease n=1 Tax=Sphaerisporangium fuscum TaxID=2835868 RepID=UPI001BDDC4AE|nr:archease [Sphaerisporangium fuscum]
MLPHTADTRIEAWAPTLAGCLAGAVRALVESFADVGRAESRAVHTVRVLPGPPGDQLVDALEEVIYLLDTSGRVPCRVEAGQDGGGVWLELGMADVEAVSQTGAVPKAVALHGLRFARRAGEWRCVVTVDV